MFISPHTIVKKVPGKPVPAAVHVTPKAYTVGVAIQQNVNTVTASLSEMCEYEFTSEEHLMYDEQEEICKYFLH